MNLKRIGIKIGKLLGSLLLIYAGVEGTNLLTNAVYKGIEAAAAEESAESYRLEYRQKHDLAYILLRPHPRLGFVLNSELAVQYDSLRLKWYLETDELGFRNEPGSKEKAEVVIVGGSAAFGATFRENSFSERLEEIIGKEVSNFTMVFYQPWQFNAVMKEYPQYFQNRTIIYCLFPENFRGEKPSDPYNYYKLKGWDKHKDAEPSEYPSFVFDREIPFSERLLAVQIYNFLTGKRGESTSLKELKQYIYKKQLSNQLSSDILEDHKWGEFMQRLEEAARISEEYNSRILFMLFPSKARLITNLYLSKLNDENLIQMEMKRIQLEEKAYVRLKAELSQRGMDTVDLLPLFLHEKGLYEDVNNTPGLHFSVNGHKKIAGRIYEALESRRANNENTN